MNLIFDPVQKKLVGQARVVRGQYDSLPVYTPANGATATHPYGKSNALKLDFSDRVTGEAVTVAITGAPAGHTALTMYVVTGADVGFTRTWPTMYAGLTFPTLTASKTHHIVATSHDGGAHWAFSLVGSW